MNVAQTTVLETHIVSLPTYHACVIRRQTYNRQRNAKAQVICDQQQWCTRCTAQRGCDIVLRDKQQRCVCVGQERPWYALVRCYGELHDLEGGDRDSPTKLGRNTKMGFLHCVGALVSCD